MIKCVQIKLLFLLVWYVLFLPILAHADTLTASIDRNQMHIGESIQLTLTVNGSADKDPDLTPLRTIFELMDQRESSNIQIINGTMSRTTQWQITLMPRQTGTLTIPQIRAGQLISGPLRLLVLPEQVAGADSLANVFLDVSVQAEDVYVQQQVLYTVRLFRAINLAQAQLTEPKVAQAIVERLGEDSTYKTQRNGKSYVVTERRYAIFPQQHGVMDIPVLQFNGRASGGGFGAFAQPGRVLRVQSKAIRIHVHTIPTSWPANTNWIPAKHVQLHEDGLTAKAIHVGDAISRTIYIQANALTAAQLPPLQQGDLPASFRQYPDQADLLDQKTAQGIVGKRQEKIVLMPTKAGQFTLPAIRLPWWNSKQQQIEVAELAARTITILPAIAASAPATGTTLLKETPPAMVATSETGVNNTLLPSQWAGWPIVAALLALGWLLTLLFQWLAGSKRRAVHKQVERENHQNVKQARKKVMHACGRNDASEAASTLLLWAQLTLPAKSIGNLQQLIQHTASADRGKWVSELQILERHLYAASLEPWNGSNLLQLLESWPNTSVHSVGKEPLPSLLG